ncbi:MAG: class I SAM-dependent methyltransferase, partial [Chloroflexota bacterium]
GGIAVHKMHNVPRAGSGPQTAGRTIHWASQYDFFTSLLGLGVNGSNSRMVVEMAAIKQGDKVLDVGCGSGNLTLTATQRVGASGVVHGLDASPEMIAVARQKAKRLRSATIFDLGLIEDLPYPEATFDVVISRLAIHHLPDELKLQGFEEIHRVLRPGGHFFMADFRLPTNPLLAHVTAALVGPAMSHYDVSSVPPKLAQTGFVEVASGPTRSRIMAYVSGRKPSS